MAPLVSLHHLDYLQSLFPNLTRIDSVKRLVGAYKTDPGRTLQQSLCYDLKRNWSVSVSWGYTLQLYPSLVTAKELGTAWLTFTTWRSKNKGPFTFNTQTVSSDPCENPVLYFLDGVERTGPGRTLTTYKRYVNNTETLCDRVDYASALAIQSFKVSAPQFNPDLWNKVTTSLFSKLHALLLNLLLYIIITHSYNYIEALSYAHIYIQFQTPT